ncbi:ester cyclase [Phaeobacter inhibens]|uniref:ester cyclase n=1 Tax=Phaeobacter inhibens TaxID=221822 RepID=UPI0021A8700E|nr:ester cyclase [Phaeobacter inhibens]UWR41302.1 ester cyclase [Phaeobacter inhibens]
MQLTPKEMLNRWLQELWVHGNNSILDELLADEAGAVGLIPDIAMKKAEFAVLAEAMRALCSDIQVQITHTVEAGDWVAVRIQVDAVGIHESRPVQATGQIMARAVQGKFHELISQFDFLTLFECLGQMPENTLPICLTGQQLTWASPALKA